LDSDDFQSKQPEIGKDAIKKLLDAIDTHIRQPVRELDKPFYLPVEQVFSISGTKNTNMPP